MKKIILSIIGLTAFMFSANAQVIQSQNFESGMGTWTQQKAAAIPTNKGWNISTNIGSSTGGGPLSGSGYLAPHTNYAWVDDYDNNSASATNNDSLYSTSMNCTAYTKVFISFDVWFQEVYATNPALAEVATIAVSTNGGATWIKADTIGGASNNNWRTATYDISAYAAGQASVMVAFTYTDMGTRVYGIGIDNVSVFVPNMLDLGVTAQNLPNYEQVNAAHAVSGTIRNFGSTTITSMNLNYSVNGGSAVTDALSSLSIPALTNYNFTHNINWTPTSDGNYTMKIWADNINGSPDQNHANDTLVATFQVIDSIAVKMPLFEEFNQASCDPCAQATPNLDSVLYNSRNICNAVRYHVSWPGTDYMNQVTNTPFVQARVVTYYGVSGVPDAKLDGSTDAYPGSIRTSDIATEAALGSPFKIGLSATYSPSTNTYAVTANIKSFGTMASGLKAQVVLTVDTMTYALNQSTETIPQYVFPQVAEDMMPNSNGTTLTAFTPEQTQTVNVSWVKNHPWAANRSAYAYDSTTTHITVFIQNNSGKYIYQSATCVPSILLGIKENSSLSYLDIYPNPATNVATVAFGMKQSENVLITVYNMLGQKVMTENEGVLAQGEHSVKLDASDLSNGIYYVNVITDNNSITKKIIISK